MSKTELTHAETTFFIHLLFKAGNGIKTLADAQYLLGDNYSWFAAKDLIGSLYNRNQVGGFMSSLEAKQIIQDNEDGHEYDWFITDKGIQKAIEIFTTFENVKVPIKTYVGA